MMKIVYSLLFIFMSAGIAEAKSPSPDYSSGGCGLGSMVVGSDGNQILAATINSTGIQTFAITSGTSNCAQDGAAQEANRIPHFIEVNKLSLAKEASRGQGETLANLASLYGCNGAKFSSAVKENYSAIFVETRMSPAGIQSTLDSIAVDQSCDPNSKLSVYKDNIKTNL